MNDQSSSWSSLGSMAKFWEGLDNFWRGGVAGGEGGVLSYYSKRLK